MKKQPTPPDEYCPECMSLKRKPNKECVNHEKYWRYEANHLMEITKDKKKYVVRCVGDYSDMVKGRNTDYEFSVLFKTLQEAEEYIYVMEQTLILEYQKHGKKASIMSRYLQK